MRRGDVYEYTPVVPRPGQSTRRLVISSDALNVEGVPVVLGIHLVDDDPDSLLAPKIGEWGWAPVLTLERVLTSRLGYHLGEATADELATVGNALKAALELD